jgi:hemerythrin-like domain-containing protein
MEKREIVNELISDHWQIRDLIKNLRAEDTSPTNKQKILRKLGTWLKCHSLGEEKTINQICKKRKKRELKVLAFEDTEEHATIDALLSKLKSTRNPYLWSARLHLVCELVEHHLDEEEEEYFPLLRQELSPEIREELAIKYRSLTTDMEPLRPMHRPGILGWFNQRPNPTSPETSSL